MSVDVTARRYRGAVVADGRTSNASLRRNRDFVLLEVGRLLSSGGSQLTTIAYPLLVLALTHSAAEAGIVTFARLVPHALLALLAGVAADRRPRKQLMIVADCVRALAIGTLVTSILLHRTAFWQIALVAFVEGTGAVFFMAAHSGALRAVVPARQLPAAVAAQGARASIVRLVGPPVGGALFGLGRAVPFLADAVSYTFSIVSLLAIRTPFQEPRQSDCSPLRAQIAEGFRFLWGQPFLRTAAFLYGLGNATGQTVTLADDNDHQEHARESACTLLGSLVSPLFRRALSMRAILLLELWAWLGTIAFLAWPNVYVLTASILPLAVTLPVTDSVVVGYRIAITPDRILGRVESVRSNISLLVGSLGPLAAGFLLSSVSARATVAVFTCCGLVLAVWGTLSPSIRLAPSLDELSS